MHWTFCCTAFISSSDKSLGNPQYWSCLQESLKLVGWEGNTSLWSEKRHLTFLCISQLPYSSPSGCRVILLLDMHIDCNLLNICMCMLLSHFSRVQLCATPETAAHQAPPSLGFFRQEHWSGLPFPSPIISKMYFSETNVCCHIEQKRNLKGSFFLPIKTLEEV